MASIQMFASEQGSNIASYTLESNPDQPAVCFTRQLWQRTMPDDLEETNTSGSYRRQRVSIGDNIARTHISRPFEPLPLSQVEIEDHRPRAQSTASTIFSAQEDSPVFAENRKRSVDQLEDEDEHGTPTHSRENSEGSFQPCLCQPEPKVPRPRNAFILYRQHHNASVVSQNPGLGNPDISKIIGQLWQNESEEEKQRWKSFAEEEKLQHQQRYPQYRYQPKRSTRRNSSASDTTPYPWSELKKCQRCGGRAIAQPNTPVIPYTQSRSNETSPVEAFTHPFRTHAIHLPPPTPSTTTTPSTRYLPMMNNLTLDSPDRHSAAVNQGQGNLPLRYEGHDGMQQPGSEIKRRRLEKGAIPPGMAWAPRSAGPRIANGPGTPFPFPQNQQVHQSRAYAGPPNAAHLRRPSLPRPTDLLHGAGHAGPPMTMGPPPRPGAGYAHYRTSAGRLPSGHDLSLTLPPLQTSAPPAHQDIVSAGSMASNTPMTATFRKVDNRPVPEAIMAMPILAKINVLRQMDTPVTHGANRAAIVAIEGDDGDAARELADWLGDFLGKDRDIDVSVMDGPKIPRKEALKKKDLFDCVRDWDEKSVEIRAMVQDLAQKNTVSTPTTARFQDSEARRGSKDSSDDDERMDLESPAAITRAKPVLLLRTHTLTATNTFSCRIPITGAYGAEDHWRWTACIWRDVVAADLTVYLKDVNSKDSREVGQVDVLGDKRLMVIKRTKINDSSSEKSDKSATAGIDAAALRRLGFEIGEWVRSY